MSKDDDLKYFDAKIASAKTAGQDTTKLEKQKELLADATTIHKLVRVPGNTVAVDDALKAVLEFAHPEDEARPLAVNDSLAEVLAFADPKDEVKPVLKADDDLSGFAGDDNTSVVADPYAEKNAAMLAEYYSSDAVKAREEAARHRFEDEMNLGLDKIFEPNVMSFKVKKLPHSQGFPDIGRATAGSSGIDLFAAISDPVPLNSMGTIVVIPTGIAIALPEGYEAQIRSRSGLASKGIVVANAPGTVDADYRGEIKVILLNTTNHRFKVEPGMRIAQMVIMPVPLAVPIYVEELDQTVRGEGGLGSTGLK